MMSVIHGWRRVAGRRLADRRGAVAILGAIAMTCVFGLAGFALDLGSAYVQLTRLQNVADTAAMAGAISWVKSSSTTAVNQTISDVVVANGWPTSVIQTAKTGYLAISPKNPLNPAIQVTLSAPSSLTLAHAITTATSVTTAVYSAVEIGSTGTEVCMLALNQLMIDGSVNVTGCSAEANGTASNSITVNGGGSLTASTINTPGGISSGGTITGTQNTGSSVKPGSDPYTSYAAEASAGFTNCQSIPNNASTLSPGCWQGTFNVPVTLSAGTYFFNGVNVNSGSSITATASPGVTIVTENGFQPDVNIAITAPTSGAWAGMAIYAVSGNVTMNSGITYNVNGAIYAPNSTVILDGSTTNASACTFIVAENITSNGGNFTLPHGSNCSNYSLAPSIGGAASTVTLVQ